jgi:hypothetical protein
VLWAVLTGAVSKVLTQLSLVGKPGTSQASSRVYITYYLVLVEQSFRGAKVKTFRAVDSVNWSSFQSPYSAKSRGKARDITGEFSSIYNLLFVGGCRHFFQSCA